MKSILEGNMYDFLKKHGIIAEYEPESFVLWTGGPTKTPFYNANKGHLRCFKADLEDITYTPDFRFNYMGITVYVETKGHEDGKFPIRKKLFRRYLDEKVPNSMYFEIHSTMQMKDMMEILEFGKIISKEKKKK